MSDNLKRAAAERAAELVTDGMRLGLGTGSTAAHFVAAIGGRVRNGLKVVGVPTSEATRDQAQREGIPLSTLDETPDLDLTVDGADELDDDLRLIKGGGGALLREKIVAAASKRMVVIADDSKRVAQLGRFPLPIEVVPFGLPLVRRRLARLGYPAAVRMEAGVVAMTDNGNYTVDCDISATLPDPVGLDRALKAIPGVVDTGLFLGMAETVLIQHGDGTVEDRHRRPG